MATITATPAKPKVGQSVLLAGSGFKGDATVTLTIVEYDIEAQVKSNSDGAVSSDVYAQEATGTLTSDATNVAATETVTIGATTYTFRASPSLAGEVAVGADAATSLANLKAAINGDAHNTANATVGASDLTATTLKLYAKTGGTAGNALATTETSAHLSFGATTLTGGAAASGRDPFKIVPQNNNPFTVKMDDGTNSATLEVLVLSD